jgi:hypothetical protein
VVNQAWQLLLLRILLRLECICYRDASQSLGIWIAPHAGYKRIALTNGRFYSAR